MSAANTAATAAVAAYLLRLAADVGRLRRMLLPGSQAALQGDWVAATVDLLAGAVAPTLDELRDDLLAHGWTETTATEQALRDVAEERQKLARLLGTAEPLAAEHDPLTTAAATWISQNPGQSTNQIRQAVGRIAHCRSDLVDQALRLGVN